MLFSVVFSFRLSISCQLHLISLVGTQQLKEDDCPLRIRLDLGLKSVLLDLSSVSVIMVHYKGPNQELNRIVVENAEHQSEFLSFLREVYSGSPFSLLQGCENVHLHSSTPFSSLKDCQDAHCMHSIRFKLTCFLIWIDESFQDVLNVSHSSSPGRSANVGPSNSVAGVKSPILYTTA